MSGRPTYSSDLTDEQWAVIGPFLQAWKDRHRSVSGHQGRYELREIVNALFYQNRTGCQWAYLPHDLPRKSATYYYFALWRDDGTDQTIHDLLRCQARVKTGRSEDPTPSLASTTRLVAGYHPPSHHPWTERHDIRIWPLGVAPWSWTLEPWIVMVWGDQESLTDGDEALSR
ncbi:transposase, partial [Micromonospora andamanensis]|uniref:transposase n=2 Tax=Micromonospora andamanensis TaxID=1287068 RepID=UPI0036356653